MARPAKVIVEYAVRCHDGQIAHHAAPTRLREVAQDEQLHLDTLSHWNCGPHVVVRSTLHRSAWRKI